MQYILKNKDEVVLEFEVEKESEIFEGQTISHFSLKNAFVIVVLPLPLLPVIANVVGKFYPFDLKSI